MNVFICRHGETDWNTLWKLQGRTDIPLNQNGKIDRSRLKKLYQDGNPDRRGIWDKAHLVIITVSWKQYPALLSARLLALIPAALPSGCRI